MYRFPARQFQITAPYRRRCAAVGSIIVREKADTAIATATIVMIGAVAAGASRDRPGVADLTGHGQNRPIASRAASPATADRTAFVTIVTGQALAGLAVDGSRALDTVSTTTAATATGPPRL